jgi:hypothetical protein
MVILLPLSPSSGHDYQRHRNAQPPRAGIQRTTRPALLQLFDSESPIRMRQDNTTVVSTETGTGTCLMSQGPMLLVRRLPQVRSTALYWMQYSLRDTSPRSTIRLRTQT